MKKVSAIAGVLFVCLISSFQVAAQKGYRGFVDVEGGMGFSSNEHDFGGGIFTVHGYQTGHSFFGVGIGVNYLHDKDRIYNSSDASYKVYSEETQKNVSIPVFAQYRYDYSLISKHSFYFKGRIGYGATGAGIFGGIGGGIRIALNGTGISALNFGLNLSVLQANLHHYERREYTDVINEFDYNDKDLKFIPSLTFGIEF